MPFSPKSTTLALSISSVSSGAVLPGSEGEQVRVVHQVTTSTGFLAFGFGTPAVASNADIPVAGGSDAVISLPAGATHVSMIVGSGTPTVYIQRGAGSMTIDVPCFSPTSTNVPQVASVVSAGAALPGTEGFQIRVVHPTTGSVAFLAFGFGAVPTATNADIPILGGTQRIFSLPPGVTHFALVVTGGTPTLHVQRGNGE